MAKRTNQEEEGICRLTYLRSLHRELHEITVALSYLANGFPAEEDLAEERSQGLVERYDEVHLKINEIKEEWLCLMKEYMDIL